MDGAVCRINIGSRQRRSRFALGVAALVAGTALAVGGWALGLAPITLVPTAVLFFGGFTGVFQAREST